MREFFTLHPVAGSWSAGTSWLRLCMAVVLSCLIHASFFLLPYLGASQLLAGLAGAGAPAREAALSVAVRLAPLPATPPAPAERAGPAAPSEAPAALEADAPQPEPRRARGADALPLPAPGFFSLDELTLRPRALGAPNLFVPGEVARAVTGGLTLRLWISESGTVESVEVIRRNVPDAVAEIAVAAFKRVPYVPGEINGRPVGTVMDVDINFDDLRRGVR